MQMPASMHRGRCNTIRKLVVIYSIGLLREEGLFRQQSRLDGIATSAKGLSHLLFVPEDESKES